MISASRIEAPVDPGRGFEAIHHFLYLPADHCIVAEVETAQTGGHIKLFGSIKVFDGYPEVCFVSGRIDTYDIFHQRFERIRATAYIQQPFVRKYFFGYHIIGAIIICIYTGLPVMSEIIV